MKKVSKIEITKPPIKTDYWVGEDFDKEGMVVQAEYNDGEIKEITDYEVLDGVNLQLLQRKVVIKYTENEETVIAEQHISVSARELAGIEIIKEPKKIYRVGDNFNSEGMIVKAMYSNGTEQEVLNYSISGGENLQIGQKSVMIIYREQGISKYVTQDIKVVSGEGPLQLTGIKIQTLPDKQEYIVGEDFDRTGMRIFAIYNNNTSESVEIRSYEIEDGENLQLGQKQITISFTEDEITVTTKLGITVIAEEDPVVLTGIKITKAPNKTEYEVGENFDPTGMVVKAEYSNGEETEITNYTIPNGINLQNGQKSVTIRYTEGGITKSTTQPITVKPAETPKLSVIINTFEEVTGGEMTYIENIKPGTTVKILKDNIETNGTIEIYKESVKITNNNTKLTTGMTVKISLNDEQRNYVIVVTGDLNGDGNMDDIDLLKLARFKVGYLDASLIGEFYRAANIVRDNECANDIDLLKMARVLVDLEEL